MSWGGGVTGTVFFWETAGDGSDNAEGGGSLVCVFGGGYFSHKIDKLAGQYEGQCVRASVDKWEPGGAMEGEHGVEDGLFLSIRAFGLLQKIQHDLRTKIS